MNLYKKIILSAALLLLLLIGANLFITMNQMQKEAQSRIDTSTRQAVALLATALNDVVDSEDIVLIINDAFHLKLFKTVTLYDNFGKVLVQRLSKSQKLSSSSLWLTPLKAGSYSHTISLAKKPHGKITVTPFIAPYYEQMDATISVFLAFFTLLALFIWILFAVIVKLILRKV